MLNLKNKKDNYPWYKFYNDVPKHLEYPEGSMIDFLLETALKYPHNYAYQYFNNKCTYKDFMEQIEACARSLKTLGVKEDDYLLMATAEHSQRTSYATGKLLTEFFMKDAVEHRQIKGCSLRFANVYSKNELLAKHVIPHVITSLMKDGKVTLLENSKINKRTFLHNIDSCAAVLAVAGTEAALDGTVYNVATEQEVSMMELVELCGKVIGIEKPEIIFEGYRESDPVRRVLSTQKLRERTGWEAKISLEQGIKMCVDYRRQVEGK